MKTLETLTEMLSKQQEILDTWSKNSKSSMEENYSNFANPIKKTIDMFSENMKIQQALLQGSPIGDNQQENFQNGSAYFQNWIALQTDFTEKWLDLYKDTYGKQVAGMKDIQGSKFSDSFKKAYEEWSELMKSAYTKLNGSLQDDMTNSSKEIPPLTSFIKAYDDLNNYWKGLLENGIIKGYFTREDFKKYMSEDAFVKIVDSLVGLHSIESFKERIETYDNFFDTYMSKVYEIQGQAEIFSNDMLGKFEGSLKDTPYESLYKMYNDVKGKFSEKGFGGNIKLQEQSQKMTETYLENRKMYLDYAQKVASFQQKIYGKAKDSLSETVESFWSTYQMKGKTPSYDDFLAQWLKISQNLVNPLLNSQEIEGLKNELEKSNIQIASAIDKMMKDYTNMVQPKKEEKKQEEGKQEEKETVVAVASKKSSK